MVFLAALVATVMITAPFLPGHGPLLAMAVLYGAGLLSVAIACLTMGRLALQALAIRGAHWRPIVFGPLATLALSIAVSQIGPEAESMKEVGELVRGPGALLASSFLLAVLAPVVEELIFRGLLFGWLEGRWGWRVTLPVSAVAFAVAHFELAYMILVLPLGFLFGWLRWRTKSLLPSIVSHMVNNGFAVLSVFLAGS